MLRVKATLVGCWLWGKMSSQLWRKRDLEELPVDPRSRANIFYIVVILRKIYNLKEEAFLISCDLIGQI